MSPGIARTRPAARTEQIILFRVSGQLFAVSSASVQEVRGVDSLVGIATELPQAAIRKVRHSMKRGGKLMYLVNGTIHFGLPAAPASLVFLLRNTRVALLIDGIEKMTTMTRLQALSNAFCHDERHWYRGLTALEQTVVPVVRPEGFLSPEELALLDASLAAANLAAAESSASEGASSAA